MLRQVGNIVLLGTSHVSKQSTEEIKQLITHLNPEVIGIELDMGRLKSLLSPVKKQPSMFELVRRVGFSGFLFAKIGGYVQKKVGKSLNIDPGEDMKTAYLTARDYKVPTILIDQEISITLRRLSKISFFKKVTMLGNLVIKSFKKEYRKKLNFDIKHLPDDEQLNVILSIYEKEVPDLYRVLIHERNIYMANKLLQMREKHPEGIILAVIGAGHVFGMEKYLREKLFAEQKINSIKFKITVDTEHVNVENN